MTSALWTMAYYCSSDREKLSKQNKNRKNITINYETPVCEHSEH